MDNPNQALIDQANAAKAVADAQAAAAVASKARYDAEAAAAKARLGDVPASGYTGSVDASGAGGAEAMLLGARALQSISGRFLQKISTAMPNPAPGAPIRILLFGATAFPDFLPLTVLATQYQSVKQAVESAQASAPINSLPQYSVITAQALTEIGLGLDAINKLLAFAKSDYKFAAVDITTTDSMLINELAGDLAIMGYHVEVPNTYFAQSIDDTNPAFQKVQEIYGWGVAAKKNIKHFQSVQSQIEQRLVATPNDAQLQSDLQTAKAAVAIWTSVGDAIDAWNKSFTTADDKGSVPLATVLRQSAIKQKLDDGAKFLVVQIHKAAGTTYTKKNLLSSLGQNPFYVMGGAVASYSLFDGTTGVVISSALLPFHGGYYSVDDIQGVVNRR